MVGNPHLPGAIVPCAKQQQQQQQHITPGLRLPSCTSCSLGSVRSVIPLGKTVPVFRVLSSELFTIQGMAECSTHIFAFGSCTRSCFLRKSLLDGLQVVSWASHVYKGLSQLCPSCSSFSLLFCLVVIWGLLLMVCLSGGGFLFPFFIPQMKGEHTPALAQQGSMSSYVPRCQKPLGLQSWALAAQWLHWCATSANLCLAMMNSFPFTW